MIQPMATDVIHKLSRELRNPRAKILNGRAMAADILSEVRSEVLIWCPYTRSPLTPVRITCKQFKALIILTCSLSFGETFLVRMVSVISSLLLPECYSLLLPLPLSWSCISVNYSICSNVKLLLIWFWF